MEHYYNDGSVAREVYRREGKLHREDGPAVVKYRADGSVERETHYREGKCHREDGPALVKYREDGSVEREAYRRDGKIHREDGPAVVEYREDGSVEAEAYYRKGEKVDKGEVIRRYLASLLHPEMSPENAAAAEWLEPHVEQDPKTLAFVPPNPSLVSVALNMFENPAV